MLVVVCCGWPLWLHDVVTVRCHVRYGQCLTYGHPLLCSILFLCVTACSFWNVFGERRKAVEGKSRSKRMLRKSKTTLSIR